MFVLVCFVLFGCNSNFKGLRCIRVIPCPVLLPWILHERLQSIRARTLKTGGWSLYVNLECFLMNWNWIIKVWTAQGLIMSQTACLHTLCASDVDKCTSLIGQSIAERALRHNTHTNTWQRESYMTLDISSLYLHLPPEEKQDEKRVKE